MYNPRIGLIPEIISFQAFRNLSPEGLKVINAQTQVLLTKNNQRVKLFVGGLDTKSKNFLRDYLEN